jgi:hypothetical protein
MTQQILPKAIWKKAWVPIRFALFGVLGFWTMMEAWEMLLERLTSVRPDHVGMSPFLLIPLSLAGAAMMLFGVGEWSRWWYLLVFLSIPLSLSLLFLFPTTGKVGVILVPALAAAGTYAIVHRRYAYRKNKDALESSRSNSR